jgi:hypothetical protein
MQKALSNMNNVIQQSKTSQLSRISDLHGVNKTVMEEEDNVRIADFYKSNFSGTNIYSQLPQKVEDDFAEDQSFINLDNSRVLSR